MIDRIAGTKLVYALEEGEIGSVLWTGQMIILHPERWPRVYNPKTGASTLIHPEHWGEH